MFRKGGRARTRKKREKKLARECLIGDGKKKTFTICHLVVEGKTQAAVGGKGEKKIKEKRF